MSDEGVAEGPSTARKHQMNQIVQDFALRTSMHGLQPIASSKTRAGQVLWFALLVLAFGYMFKSNVSSVQRYFSYPYSTEVGEEFAAHSGLKFPSITVCPMNLFVKKKIELQDEDRMFNSMHLNLEICKDTRAARRKYHLTCGKFLLCTLNIYSIGGRDCGPENSLILSDYHNANTNASLTSYEEQFRDVYGPNLKHSLYECMFGSKKCGGSNFTKQITEYGQCFQFNGDSENPIYSFGFGVLNLVLDAKVDEYTNSPFFTEGFKFHIQDQGTFTPPSEGFVVSPGNLATVNVRQKRNTYLSSPYKSNCTNRSLHRYNTYSIRGCLSECYEDLKIRKCGCRACGYLDSSTQDIRVCGGNDTVCESRLMRSKFSPRNCDCRPPCSEITYTYKLSYSTFPDVGSSRLLKKYRRTSVEYQRKNLVAITIHYVASSYSKSDEKESDTLESLLGEIGGNLGLMVGCSVLTAAECLELILQLIAGVCQKILKRNERKVAWESPEVERS